ncbi:hypothetical protein SGM_1820 [Streptomyces griseoaurantiacus M045]|uniref:Uncharacterized protein n=1 Tax=Streptomyces griseoaurantiacus M045 TaxID=996637 RepID=F3NFC1_9ACTN|nr:hypothetical protein SGM_1820 [Streptomyces griseoaurantiacus M045]
MRMTQKTLLTMRATYLEARGAHDVRAKAVVVRTRRHAPVSGGPASSVVKSVVRAVPRRQQDRS